MNNEDMNSMVTFVGTIMVAGMFGLAARTMAKAMTGDRPPGKLLSQAKAVVECPICGEVVDIPDYNGVSRTEALRRHIDKAHRDHQLRPQALMVEGGEPLPGEYRDLAGFLEGALPEYSLAVLPAIQAEPGEKKIDVVMRQLKTGVEGIVDSEKFRTFLTTMSKFHDYSIGNQILIAIQKPEATKVAGFNSWKDLGRFVKKGERGIAILAPVFPPRPSCDQCGAKVPKSAKYCPGCGASMHIEVAAEPRHFRVVHVFDISQTEGKPLPEFEVPVLTGEMNRELHDHILSLMEKQGVMVSFEPDSHLEPGVKGYFAPPSLIWIRPGEPPAQQLKTLLHEAAHYYTEGVFQIPRADAETIAESAAYVVGAHYGFDTGVRSFPYVALWSRDKKVLEQNLSAIRRVATTMLEGMEK